MQSPQQIINNCFQEQSVRIITGIFENNTKSQLCMEEVIENFKQMWVLKVENTSEPTSSKIKPKVKKPVKKRAPIPDNERCCALKKDGGRCAAKAYAGGRNPKICTLHNTKGANFGFVVEDTPEEIIEQIEDSDNEDTLSKEEYREMFGDVSSDNEEIF